MFALSMALMIGSTTLHMGETIAFSFNSVGYVQRYTKGNLSEFTPKGQGDLKAWVDMVTINDYPTVKTGEDLAKSANSVLNTYKDHKAVVVKTNSVPRTAAKEAEHLIVVMFPRPDFIEASFARVLISDGKGYSIVYSHRVYGKKAGDSMSKWLLKNGDVVEKALMAMPSVPKH